MELHLALRNIVKTDGPSIIAEGRLVNILCDFQAFDAIPASKYVMRAIIDDGYSKKLLQCAKWDMAAQQLSGQFASSTGFQPDIVWTIFQSLAYGLGWVNGITPIATSSNPVQAPPPNKQKYSLANNPTIDDVRNYLSSIVERVPESELALGVSFSNISCGNFSEYKDNTSYECYLEVRGKIKEPRLIIRVITYDTDGRIFHSSDVSVSKNDLKGFGVYSVCSFMKHIKPERIGRILIMAV